jgi:hypothetical protein
MSQGFLFSVSAEELAFEKLMFPDKTRRILFCADCRRPYVNMTFHLRTCGAVEKKPEPTTKPTQPVMAEISAPKVSEVPLEITPPSPTPSPLDRYIFWTTKKGYTWFNPVIPIASQEAKNLLVPTLACHLWNVSKAWAKLFTNMPPDMDPETDWLWVNFKKEHAKYVGYLVECGFPEVDVLRWAKEAWHRVTSGYVPYFEWPREAKDLLAQLGYELAENEFIGWAPPKRF